MKTKHTKPQYTKDDLIQILAQLQKIQREIQEIDLKLMSTNWAKFYGRKGKK